MAAAERGANPTVLARMRTGWAVIGDTQHLPGYSLLLYAGRANHLTDLPRSERALFLFDLSLLGEAVQAACVQRDTAFRRLNYEVAGELLGSTCTAMSTRATTGSLLGCGKVPSGATGMCASHRSTRSLLGTTACAGTSPRR